MFDGEKHRQDRFLGKRPVGRTFPETLVQSVELLEGRGGESYEMGREEQSSPQKGGGGPPDWEERPHQVNKRRKKIKTEKQQKKKGVRKKKGPANRVGREGKKPRQRAIS